ncbi:MAG: ATP-binding protein [Bacteroidota bacterium]
MKIEIPDGIEILVFTGPESSGKTTCAKRISTAYNLPRVEEYAREYLIQNGTDYTFDDLQIIAQKQQENECLAHQENALIVCDTDVVTMEIWANVVYNKSMNLTDERRTKKYYFLCSPDIPWESDPFRENPNDRDQLFERYQTYLNEHNLPYSILSAEKRRSLELDLRSKINK